MTIEIKLPEIGDGIDSGDVLDVLVREGDIIQVNQDIVELETDKATMGVPSTHAGKVITIHVREGDTVPIGGTLITLEAVNESAEAKPKPSPAKPVEAKPEIAPPKPVERPPAPAPVIKTAPHAPAPRTSAPPASVIAAEPADPPDLDEVAAGPAIRRLAREVGVDLRNVAGTGQAGRIQREDVLAVVRKANQTQVKPGGEAARDQWGPIRFESLSKIRATIAQKMHESWTTVPRVTNFDDADITELESFRKGSKSDYAVKGIKLTTMPFVIKAVAMSLQSHPGINASLDLENNQIIYKDYVNIGIAVDTDRGLVVPSLRGADDQSISEIAQSLAELAEKVRDGKFKVEDLRGSTFTISNLGAIGGTYSTPIINVPEVAILLVGRARKMPVVIDDEVRIRLMMPLSLSYDHRLVDGAMAARFLNDVIGYLKAPSRLLLAP